MLQDRTFRWREKLGKPYLKLSIEFWMLSVTLVDFYNISDRNTLIGS